MIKVSVLYPSSETASFNMDYYCNTHIPMVREKLGEPCRNIAVEGGLAGGADDLPPPYIAMGHLYFDSVDVFESSFGPHAKDIMGDLPNFTNIVPVLQVSEVHI